MGNKHRIKLTFKEEVANSVTHGVMSILTLLALPMIAIYSYTLGGWAYAIGVSVFMISIFMMFLTSTLYHVMDFDSKHKDVFQKLDHIMIFLAIAGTYTPIAITLIGGWQGALILVIQWSMVLIGIFFKLFSKKQYSKLSLSIYLIMGWSIVFFLPVLFQNASPLFFGLILGGGICYSVGAYYYTKRTMKYHHMIWHLFINIAAILQFIAVVFVII